MSGSNFLDIVSSSKSSEKNVPLFSQNRKIYEHSGTEFSGPALNLIKIKKSRKNKKKMFMMNKKTEIFAPAAG